jgi:hypothetical protein
MRKEIFYELAEHTLIFPCVATDKNMTRENMEKYAFQNLIELRWKMQ